MDVLCFIHLSIEGHLGCFQLQFWAIMNKAAINSLWCWEGLGAGGKGDDRGWDGWMASPTRWTWVWVNSGSWWWTGRPGVLQFMGSQRVRHNWATQRSLGGQATAGEHSPGRSLCLTKSSACGRLWQFAHPRPLSLLPRGLAPRGKRTWCWERLKVGERDDRGWDGSMAPPTRWT